MLIASAAKTVIFHDFPSGDVVHTYKPQGASDAPIRSISWCKDGSWLALVPQSGLTEIVTVKGQLKLLQTVQGVCEPSCVSFQKSTKKNIALGTKNGLVLVYDIKSRSIKKSYPRLGSCVTMIEFTSKDNHIVACTAKGDVMVYSNVSNNLSTALKFPKKSSDIVSAMRTNMLKKSYIVGGSNCGAVVVWDINTSKCVFSMKSHQAPISSVSFSPINSNLLISTGLDRQFCFYDASVNKCISTISVDNNMTGVDFSPDGTFFAMSSQSGQVHVFDARRIQAPMHTYQSHTSTIQQLSFQTDRDLDSSVYSIRDNCTDNLPTVAISSATPTNNNDKSFDLAIDNIIIQNYSQSPSLVCVDAGGGDSFIAALGLDQNNTATGGGGESLYLSDITANKSMVDAPVIHKTPVLPAKMLNNKSEGGGNYFTPPQQSSTPIVTLDEATASDGSSPNPDSANKSTLKEVAVAGIDVDELSALLDGYRTEVKYSLMDASSQMRQMFLGMQMTMVRQFMKMEDFMNGFKDELLGPHGLQVDDAALLMEIGMLKDRLALAEQELMVLKSNRQN